jgi:hypothetical protein
MDPNPLLQTFAIISLPSIALILPIAVINPPNPFLLIWLGLAIALYISYLMGINVLETSLWARLDQIMPLPPALNQRKVQLIRVLERYHVTIRNRFDRLA